MALKGTKTAENLLKAFAGECQANRRYTYYANVAKKQGYVQIASIFEETADQESMHAKRFFKFLNDDKELQVAFVPCICGQSHCLDYCPHPDM